MLWILTRILKHVHQYSRKTTTKTPRFCKKPELAVLKVFCNVKQLEKQVQSSRSRLISKSDLSAPGLLAGQKAVSNVEPFLTTCA